jgi:hypothetical protein
MLDHGELLSRMWLGDEYEDSGNRTAAGKLLPGVQEGMIA